jgi:hypothetical protein
MTPPKWIYYSQPEPACTEPAEVSKAALATIRGYSHQTQAMPDQRAPLQTSWYARRPTLAAFLGLLGLAALFYLPLLLGLRTFADGDFTHHFLPFSLFQHAALRGLTLPLWNPYTYGGHPFLADIQAAAYYPVSNALLFLTLPFDEPAARLYWLQIEAILQTALGGFFVYLLLVDLANARLAAFAGGAIFLLSGYLTAYPPLQLAVLRTAIWLPLILWFLWRAFGRGHALGWWIGGGVAYAVAFTAGHPQTFLHISYATAAWTLFLWIAAVRRGMNSWWQPLPGLALFVVAAAGLSAAQLLPSLEFTRLSVRAEVDYAYVSGGFPLRDTWQLFFPKVFTQYSPLYVGAVGLALAFFGLGALTSGRYASATAKPDRPASTRFVIAFFAILGLIALLLSYGANGFLYPLFYRLAPGWSLFRGQERTAYLVALSLSVLAGFGLAALPHMGLRLRKRLALLYGAGLTMLVYTFGLLWQATGRTAIGPWHYLLIATLTLLLGIGAALLAWLPGWDRRRAALLTGLALVNLFLANFGLNFGPFDPARAVILAPEMAALGAAVAERDEANLGLPGRVYNEFRVYEDYGMGQEIEDVWGASPLRLARYALLFDEFPLDRMWALTGVEHVLTWRSELFEPSTRLAEFPQREDTTYLHRLAEPNPRAWLVPTVRAVDDLTARDLLADHQFDLTQTALLPIEALPGAEQAPLAQAGQATIALARPAHNRLAIDVNGPGGLLVIGENWLPGWRIEHARCGDAPCASGDLAGLPLLQPLRADLTLIGVPLPPGAVRFDLVYAPASVRNGLWIALATLALLLLLGVLAAVRRRRQP